MGKEKKGRHQKPMSARPWSARRDERTWVWEVGWR